jgi:DNA-binding protein YbaB
MYPTPVALQVVGEAGSGMVRATLGGDGRIVSLEVSPHIGKEGGQAIAELVSAAVNRAHDRLREETRKTIVDSLPPNVELRALSLSRSPQT